MQKFEGLGVWMFRGWGAGFGVEGIGDTDTSTGGKDTSSDLSCIAEQAAPVPHLANPEGCAALRIVLVTVTRARHCCEHFPDGFDLHFLHG